MRDEGWWLTGGLVERFSLYSLVLALGRLYRMKGSSRILVTQMCRSRGRDESTFVSPKSNP